MDSKEKRNFLHVLKTALQVATEIGVNGIDRVVFQYYMSEAYKKAVHVNDHEISWYLNELNRFVGKLKNSDTANPAKLSHSTGSVYFFNW